MKERGKIKCGRETWLWKGGTKEEERKEVMVGKIKVCEGNSVSEKDSVKERGNIKCRRETWNWKGGKEEGVWKIKRCEGNIVSGKDNVRKRGRIKSRTESWKRRKREGGRG